MLRALCLGLLNAMCGWYDHVWASHGYDLGCFVKLLVKKIGSGQVRFDEIASRYYDCSSTKHADRDGITKKSKWAHTSKRLWTTEDKSILISTEKITFRDLTFRKQAELHLLPQDIVVEPEEQVQSDDLKVQAS
ncbi:hypothetical protein KSP40_PGU021488 [Platanthera guangdongensis]|uniref:Uncharacterized protein n=1 Tax=Platanthera guangdongensis TaxID=2320717 RepID=A0ABR2MBC1_9ASPA